VPLETLRPTGVVTAYPRRVNATGGTEPTVVNDQSDATYVRRSSDGSPIRVYYLPSVTVPGGSDIATIVAGARIKQPTAVSPSIYKAAMGLRDHRVPNPYVGGPYYFAQLIALGGVAVAATTYVPLASTGAGTSPEGVAWAMFYNLVAIDDGHATADTNRATIYEVFATAYTAAQPTASTATTPTSPVTLTSYPTLTVTVSALVETWQDNLGPATGTACPIEI
jgi:hypothetical protein